MVTLCIYNLVRAAREPQGSHQMHTISISKFKATCLAVLDRVRKPGGPLLLQKHWFPFPQVLPAPPAPPPAAIAFGSMPGTADEVEDMLAPLPEEDWDALR